MRLTFLFFLKPSNSDQTFEDALKKPLRLSLTFADLKENNSYFGKRS